MSAGESPTAAAEPLPCSKCGLAVTDDALEILHKTWHRACFQCTTCQEVLQLNSFAGFEGKPYCRAHYLSLFGAPAIDVAFVPSRRPREVPVPNAPTQPAASDPATAASAKGSAPAMSSPASTAPSSTSATLAPPQAEEQPPQMPKRRPNAVIKSRPMSERIPAPLTPTAMAAETERQFTLEPTAPPVTATTATTAADNSSSGAGAAGAVVATPAVDHAATATVVPATDAKEEPVAVAAGAENKGPDVVAATTDGNRPAPAAATVTPAVEGAKDVTDASAAPKDSEVVAPVAEPAVRVDDVKKHHDLAVPTEASSAPALVISSPEATVGEPAPESPARPPSPPSPTPISLAVSVPPEPVMSRYAQVDAILNFSDSESSDSEPEEMTVAPVAYTATTMTTPTPMVAPTVAAVAPATSAPSSPGLTSVVLGTTPPTATAAGPAATAAVDQPRIRASTMPSRPGVVRTSPLVPPKPKPSPLARTATGVKSGTLPIKMPKPVRTGTIASRLAAQERAKTKPSAVMDTVDTSWVPSRGAGKARTLPRLRRAAAVAEEQQLRIEMAKLFRRKSAPAALGDLLRNSSSNAGPVQSLAESEMDARGKMRASTVPLRAEEIATMVGDKTESDVTEVEASSSYPGSEQTVGVSPESASLLDNSAKADTAGASTSGAEPEAIRLLRKKRINVAMEIATTERSYVDSLFNVVHFIIEPLRAAAQTKKPIIGNDDILEIFSNMEVVAYCHELLAEALEARLGENSSDPIVGDVLRDKTKFLRIYTTYVSNYEVALTALKRVERIPAFKTFLEHAANENKESFRKLELKSFLIMPIQRIPRYVLLLKELLKCTPEGHPDRENLTTALTSISEVAAIVDKHDAKLNADHLSKVRAVQNSMTGDYERLTYDKQRRYVMEGGLAKTPSAAKEKGTKRKRHFFLFSDILIYAAYAKLAGFYEYKGTIDLTDAYLKTDVDVSDDRGFVLVTNSGTYTLYASTAAECDTWAEAISATILAHQEQFIENTTEERDGPRDPLASAVALVLGTEMTFVADLENLQKHFLEPIFLSAAPASASVEQPLPASLVAPLVDALCNLHRRIIAVLDAHSREWKSDAEFAADMAAILDYNSMKLYQKYVKRASSFLFKLNIVAKDKSVKASLEDFESKTHRKVHSVMQAPFQRVSVYVELVRVLLQIPRATATDGAELTELLNTMAALERSNELATAAAARNTQLYKIMDRMIDWPSNEIRIPANRSLVREGLLTKLPSRKALRPGVTLMRSRTLRFILMSDMLVFAEEKSVNKKTEPNLVFKGRIPLRDATVVTVHDMGHETTAFEVTAAGTTLCIRCTDNADREEWVSDIEAAIEELRDEGGTGHVAVTVRDEEGDTDSGSVRLLEAYEAVRAFAEKESVLVGRLTLLVDGFIKPLRAKKLALKGEEVTLLCTPVMEQIVGLYAAVASEVRACIANWDSERQNVATIFEDRLEELQPKLTEYLNALTARLVLFDQCMLSIAFQAFVVDFEAASRVPVKETLRSLPDGIHHHAELLRQLVLHVPADEASSRHITQVSQSVRNASSFTRTLQTDVNTQYALAVIEQHIAGNFQTLVSSHRHLVKEGPLTKCPGSSSKVTKATGRKKRHFLLFTDMILYCAYNAKYFGTTAPRKKDKKELEFKGRIELNEVELRDVPNDFSLDIQYGFELVSKAGTGAFLIMADTQVEKEEWMQAIRNCLANVGTAATSTAVPPPPPLVEPTTPLPALPGSAGASPVGGVSVFPRGVVNRGSNTSLAPIGREPFGRESGSSSPVEGKQRRPMSMSATATLQAALREELDAATSRRKGSLTKNPGGNGNGNGNGNPSDV